MDLPENLPANPQEETRSSTLPALPTLQMFNIASHFAGAIAHDFNNILTGVLGNLELMQRRAHRVGNSDFDDYLAGARSAAKRGVEFSQSLLAIAGHQQLESKPIQLDEIIIKLQLHVSANARQTIKFQLLDKSATSEIICDKEKLQEALLQLTQNATESVGTSNVIVSAGKMSVDHSESLRHGIPGGDYIVISVHDDGAGMSGETANRAFEPFFSKKGARGLGLAKVLGFARQSGGHAFIARHQPGDTNITLLLPIAK